MFANSLIRDLWTQIKNTKKQLDDIDKQHKFIILRTLYSGNYETEMNRSMILENLVHIYESLCFATGTMASKPYRGRRPIEFTKIKKNHAKTVGAHFL